MSTNTTDRTGRLEGAIEVVILLAVAAMAGAASFTHVHDWTMRFSPSGTGNWFGWANAMVSELIPLAAGLEARRRHRTYGHAGTYPIALIVGAVALSLTGQFSEATPSFFGWLVAAVPALGFMALVKLAVSRPTGTPVHDNNRETKLAARIQELETQLASQPAPSTPDTAPATKTPTKRTPAKRTPAKATPAKKTAPAKNAALVVPTAPNASGIDTAPLTHLVPSARYAVTNHEATTGRAITVPELATRMSVSPEVAGRLLAAVGLPEPKPTVTAGTNGTAVDGAR